MYGLEVQKPFSSLILSGQKTVETRGYRLPPDLINTDIYILEPLSTEEGVSQLGETITCGQENVAAVGTVSFIDCFQYENEEQWRLDESNHQVPVGSKFDWKVEKDFIIFGWKIDKIMNFEKAQAVPAMKRVFRSIFVTNNH